VEKIIIFILFLGPLVFFHELGHFFFARLFGVRVETFSIGFGPKLIKFLRGDTEYAISAIPLGGYVKMFGDDPRKKDEIPQELRDISFIHKGKWARFWIVIGGPLANFILAYFIFFSLLMSGERIPEIKTGVIPKDTILFEQGIRTGDIVKKVNGRNVYNPADLSLKEGEILTALEVERLGERKVLNTTFTGNQFLENLMKYPPYLRKPLLVGTDGKEYALSFDKEKIDFKRSLDEMAQRSQSKLYLFSKIIGEQYKFNKEVLITHETSDEFFIKLKELNLIPYDLTVKSVKMGSPADKTGVRAGDIFVSINGEEIFSFEDLRNKLQISKESKAKLTFYRDGKLQSTEITPEVKTENDQTYKLIGVYSSGEFLSPNFIMTESKGLSSALVAALDRTWDGTVKTFDGFKKLLKAEAPFKSIGGPLSIGKVASDSFNTSLSYFFQLMALISINLGIINLFPIPVLDGGHIMFIIFEIFNRGPLSERKMEIAQQVGLSILLMLMVGAIFNDFSRFF
jgi:regulator of sigma E protease